MTILRLTFAGQIRRSEAKNIAGKQVVEFSICKKNRGKQGDPDTFTWLRVTLWEPAAFQLPHLGKGSFVAGSGEMQLRSYRKQDGSTGHNLEISCRSFDVEPASAGHAAPQQPAAQPATDSASGPQPADLGDEEPPF